MPAIDIQNYWTIFPIGLTIATVAMLTGIDGAAFWGPVLLLVFKVDPAVAVACGIFIEVFGFGSGVYGYAKRGKIMFKEAVPFLFVAVPLGVGGAYLTKTLSPVAITAAIGVGCLFLTYRNLAMARRSIPERLGENLSFEEKPFGYFLSGIGGFLTGVIGFGLGLTNNYYLLVRNKFPATYAAGTTVFMIAVTALATSVLNIIYFRNVKHMACSPVLNILVFAVPAVIIGGQIGVRLAHVIYRRVLLYIVGAVFTLMAIMAFVKVFR